MNVNRKGRSVFCGANGVQHSIIPRTAAAPKGPHSGDPRANFGSARQLPGERSDDHIDITSSALFGRQSPIITRAHLSDRHQRALVHESHLQSCCGVHWHFPEAMAARVYERYGGRTAG